VDGVVVPKPNGKLPEDGDSVRPGAHAGIVALQGIDEGLAAAVAFGLRTDNAAQHVATGPQPRRARSTEAYIQFTSGLFTDDDEVTVGSIEEFLRTYMTEFHSFITRVLSVLPRNA
jgi:hypothetical protein